jgi:hypothetical protein
VVSDVCLMRGEKEVVAGIGVSLGGGGLPWLELTRGEHPRQTDLSQKKRGKYRLMRGCKGIQRAY